MEGDKITTKFLLIFFGVLIASLLFAKFTNFLGTEDDDISEFYDNMSLEELERAKKELKKGVPIRGNIYSYKSCNAIDLLYVDLLIEEKRES